MVTKSRTGTLHVSLFRNKNVSYCSLITRPVTIEVMILLIQSFLNCLYCVNFDITIVLQQLQPPKLFWTKACEAWKMLLLFSGFVLVKLKAVGLWLCWKWDPPIYILSVSWNIDYYFQNSYFSRTTHNEWFWNLKLESLRCVFTCLEVTYFRMQILRE